MARQDKSVFSGHSFSIWQNSEVVDCIFFVDLRLLLHYELRVDERRLISEIADDVIVALRSYVGQHQKSARFIVYYDDTFEQDCRPVYQYSYQSVADITQAVRQELGDVIEVFRCSNVVDADLMMAYYKAQFQNCSFYNVVPNGREDFIDPSLFSGVVPVYNHKGYLNYAAQSEVQAWLVQEGFLGTSKQLKVYLDIDNSLIDYDRSFAFSSVHFNERVIGFLSHLLEQNINLKIVFCTARKRVEDYEYLPMNPLLDESIQFFHPLDEVLTAELLSRRLPGECRVEGIYYSNSGCQPGTNKHKIIRDAVESKGEYVLFIDDNTDELDAVESVREECPRCVAPVLRVHAWTSLTLEEVSVLQFEAASEHSQAVITYG